MQARLRPAAAASNIVLSNGRRACRPLMWRTNYFQLPKMITNFSVSSGARSPIRRCVCTETIRWNRLTPYSRVYLFCFAFSRNRMTHFLNLLHFFASVFALLSNALSDLHTHFNLSTVEREFFVAVTRINSSLSFSFGHKEFHIWVAKSGTQPHTRTGSIHSISPRRISESN